jgi:N-dimethylarginine dimethylaminohydrolase
MTHTVLMGDPTHFSVVGGANPHTRDRWGRRKHVDRALAIRQWQRMRELLTGLGLRVAVVPPDPRWPGLVYPANAGFRHGDCFVLSNLTPTRAGEQAYYREIVESLGLACATLSRRFEGEADLFPAGKHFIQTYGAIRKQRFVPRFGIPPWKRVYGFRSDPAALAEIEAIAPLPHPVLPVELVDERYYHGDTCLCSFGSEREFLLAYLPALGPASATRLHDAFGERLIPLGDADAAIYAANSFALNRGPDQLPLLVMPDGISAELEARIRTRGVDVLKVDVSEFYKKGGGSVKCMIGDLGELPCISR